MTTAPESINIHTDSPINDLREDKFGRASLVELLAKSIQTKCESEHDSLCIGIYGKWGEGKTSFVNMLKQKIKLDNPTLSKAIVDFNPWIINEEKGLIKDFFKTIAGNAEGELKEFIAKYGGIIAYSAQIVGNVVAPGLGASFKKHVKELNKYILKASETSIEQQKEDISNELVDTNKHLIVFIDDIDRLDCDEMHAVFRLVRQVADFKNTIYVLSLDEERVAKSIGKYFGEGCESDGRQFLEKIVQVPIVLPNIQETKIKELLQDALEDVYDSCGLKEKDEIEAIVDRIHYLFETQREIIRYKNQLMFFFPTAHTEVNHSDYCILEAIKVQHLPAYNMLRTNKSYMIKELPWSYDNTTEEKDLSKLAEEEHQKFIRKVTNIFPEHRRDGIRGILKFFLSPTASSDEQKRFFDQIYFDRYFLQTAPENVIPDKVIDMLDCLELGHLKEWINSVMSQRYKVGEIARSLMGKIDRQSDLSSKEMANICLAIAEMSHQEMIPQVASQSVNKIFPKLSDEDIKEVAASIFSSAKLEYAIFVFVRVVVNFQSKLHFDEFNIFKNRLLEKSSLAPFLLKGNYQKLFFKTWKELDNDKFIDYAKMSFGDSGFDASKFIENYMTESWDIRDFTDFISLFGNSLEILYDKLKNKDAAGNFESKFVRHYCRVKRKPIIIGEN